MSDEKKRLLNEVLPDPTDGVDELERKGPRQRTSDHLKRLLAAAGLALGAPAYGDATPPPQNKPGDTKPGDKKPPDNKKPEPPPQPPPPRYDVVDPVPAPYIEREEAPGFLKLTSKPVAEIFVDGTAHGKTPQAKIKLTPGIHNVMLRANGREETFTVEIRSKQTTVEVRDLRPKENDKK
jgi:hypothetical protein